MLVWPAATAGVEQSLMENIMRIENKTRYKTSDLRRVFSAVLAETNKTEKILPSKYLKISVAEGRTANHSGWAYLNSGRVHIVLPKENLNVFHVGFVFEHELAHCRGYNHKTMGWLNEWKNATLERFPYLQSMNVELKPVTSISSKPQVDVQMKRYEAALFRLEKWRKKRETALRHEQVYLSRAKRYEKIFADDGRLAALKTKRKDL